MTYLQVFLVSAMPISEIRGGIPLGLSLGLSNWEAFFMAFLGNVFIVIPWVLVLCKLESFFATYRYTARVYAMMVRKAEKRKHTFQKYGKFALFFFVAIPLPTTGAWTACVASRIFRIPLWDTFWVVALGICASGLKILFLSNVIRTMSIG